MVGPPNNQPTIPFLSVLHSMSSVTNLCICNIVKIPNIRMDKWGLGSTTDSSIVTYANGTKVCSNPGGKKYFTSWEPRLLGRYFTRDSVIHGPAGAL